VSTSAAIRKHPRWSIAIVVILLAALILLWKLLPVVEWTRELLRFVSGLGYWGPLIFSPIYIVASVIGIPRTALNIGAGILFSFPVAMAVVLVSASVDFILTFLLARYALRDWAKKAVARIPKAEDAMKLVEEESFKLVFLIRLNPFIPAVIKGYGFGTTPVPLRTYFVASILGFLPIALAHVYLGWLGGVGMMHSDQQPALWKVSLLIGGGIFSVLLVAFISWLGNRALNKRTTPVSA
jgi:uncharacterized membrane protein YdjX (TVP38/TMEM64 family)